MKAPEISPAEAQDLLNVTPDSLAKHCGLINNPANPDTRSEDLRLLALRRQLGLVQRWPRPQTEALYCEFSAKYLPQLVAQYKQSPLPCNIAMIMINVVSHLPYFVRFQRTPAASDLVALHATRIVDHMNDASPAELVAEVCQFLSTLLVLQGSIAIPSDVKERLHPTFAMWRRRYDGQFSGETADRCYQLLKGTLEMGMMARMMKEQLERPLSQCGVRGCDRRADAGSPGLKQCSRCKSAIYASHSKFQ